MKKLVLLMILLAVVFFTAGCIDNNWGNSTSSELSQGISTPVKITQLEQINTSLEKGPIFMRMGSKWCPDCRSMKPILEKLAVEYQGNATIAYMDVDQNPELAEYFGAKTIPDSFVIVDIENGTYVYMQKNGKISTDRNQARIIGLSGDSEDDENVFERVLNFALLQQGNNISQ
ncbi:thioredoxin family protein [Methanosarcina acetivorans]|nr:thioredoxin family protein [Methanosarcina acetivorans]